MRNLVLAEGEQNSRSQDDERSPNPSLRAGEPTQAARVFAARRRAGRFVHVVTPAPSPRPKEATEIPTHVPRADSPPLATSHQARSASTNARDREVLR